MEAMGFRKDSTASQSSSFSVTGVSLTPTQADTARPESRNQQADVQAQAPMVESPVKTRWAPRVWLGMDGWALLRFLGHNRFRVSPSLWHVALTDIVFSNMHTFLRYVQQAFLGRRIARTKIEKPPLFILGHWRTGTTLLHELMILDQRHAFPNTYQCFAPNHFLLTEWIANRYLNFLLPPNRQMDGMAMGWQRPQEDEFALCNMGVPSPYLNIMFPNESPQFPEYMDLRSLEPKQRESWKEGLLHFLKQVSYKNPEKRIVLKSPPHTSRIPVLREMFPEARFIHIVRNPYVVFPSTVHLWRKLYENHGLQRPKFEGLEEWVLDTFVEMNQRVEEDSKDLDDSRFLELRYEDLTENPIDTMRGIYEKLELGDFESVLPRLREYLGNTKDYQTNRYRLTPQQQDAVTKRWGPVIRRFDYEIEE
jgi:hypothetical protein